MPDCQLRLPCLLSSRSALRMDLSSFSVISLENVSPAYVIANPCVFVCVRRLEAGAAVDAGQRGCGS